MSGQSKSRSDELKPCPFCGGPVTLERTTGAYEQMHGRREWWGVVCRNTTNRGGTCAVQITPSASKEAATDRWNLRAAVSEQQPINKLPRDSMVIDPLPEMVMEAIDAYGRYYAEQHKLGMSVRDDMKYIASVAIRSVTGGDGGLDISQELRSVLAWEAKRMGRVSAGVLKSVIKRLEDLLPASTQNQSNERKGEGMSNATAMKREASK